MKVAISGASGFVGQSLKDHLLKQGYEVVCIKREMLIDASLLLKAIDGVDVVINLNGASIMKRWSKKYKKLLYKSRINTTQNIVEGIKNAKVKPALFISTSAVGIYKSDKCYDENADVFKDDFLSKLCQEWESGAKKVEQFGVRSAIFRLGVVLGKKGALEKMLFAFRLGLGGKIGNGEQKFSFIHIDDLLCAYDFIMQNESLNGVFNLTTPHVITNNKLTKLLAKHLKRPAFFTVPVWALKLMYGEGSCVLTDSQCATPNRLIKSGFAFRYAKIQSAIEDIVKI